MRTFLITALIVLVFVTAGGSWLSQQDLHYAYLPDEESIVKGQATSRIATFHQDEEKLNPEQVQLGRELFYKETFGNEVFFTDILGMFNGPLTLGNMAKAIAKLNGEGTSNLRVEAYEDFEAGPITIKKGELIDTGLDVAKGAKVPLGVRIAFSEGRLKAGISCAVCHATVNEKGKVLEGLPNTDLQIGLALALGTNTAAYFTHTELESIKDYVTDTSLKVQTTEGKTEALPDIRPFERFVDREVIKWPAGSNDTTIDFHNNPVQVPDAMTAGDHPFGWSGQGQIGPFDGASAAINNAHSQNMDAVSASEISSDVLKIDKEVYLGTVLQHAATEKYRYKGHGLPSDFFARVDPTPGVPGVNTLAKSPTYPKASYMTSVGLFSSAEGYQAYEQLNAMSAYMKSLTPLSTGVFVGDEVKSEGRRVFTEAGCIRCHGGPNLTSNQLIKVEELRTDESRAKGFSGLQKFFQEPLLYSLDTPVPLPKNPKVVKVPMSATEEQNLQLAWGFTDGLGAYKTISLFNLRWSAPYLHDGGVAVGKDGELGVTGTLLKGNSADPYLSLKALVDSQLRADVLTANAASKDLTTAHITGKGHTYWVDKTTGFTAEEQDALIRYLLTVTD